MHILAENDFSIFLQVEKMTNVDSIFLLYSDFGF